MAEDLPRSTHPRHFETTRRSMTRPDNNLDQEDNYFERASFIYYVVIFLGLGTFEVLCFQPQYYPFEMLGGPGARLLYLAENHLSKLQFGFFVAILLHIIEAVYAYFKCKSVNLSNTATMKWTLQTFILGFSSLRLLNAYCDKKNKHS